MKSSEYWQQRFAQLEASQHREGVACYAEIEKQYKAAQKELEGQITSWYGRFAKNNEMTMVEARRALDAREMKELKWDVQEYIKYGRENAIEGQWMKELENASAAYHISRLEALKLHTQQCLEKMFGNQLDSVDSAMRDIYKNGYYRTAFEIQKGVGVGWDFSSLDERTINKVIRNPWTVDQKNFSQRIWGNCRKANQEVSQTLTRNIILGQDPQKAIDQISRRMDVSKRNTGRLVMTEEAYFSSEATRDAFKELDVEEYEIVATLDSHTSETCREMDGKRFKMSEWEVGETAPPFHVWCRTTTAPYFDDEEGERAARGEDGKTYYVPSDMTYKQWEKTFVKGDKTNVEPVQKTEPKEEDDISSYISQRKIYDEKMQELSNLEKESGEILDAFMDAIDTPKADELEEAYNKKYDELEHLREIIKDVKSVLKGKEAKAVRQIEKNLAIKTGMDIKNIDMTGLEYGTANSIYNAYTTVLDKYPEVKKNLTSFRYSDKKGNAYASCVALTGDVKAHGLFKNYANLVQQYADDVGANYHPVGTDHNSIIVHELGHALDGYMTKEKMLNAIYNQYGIIRSSVEVQKRVLDKLGWDFDYVKNLRDDLTLKGYKHSQIADIIKEKRKKFITNHISEYAAENEKEFFAECFAEWIMSKTPRKAARIFGEIIDDALGR